MKQLLSRSVICLLTILCGTSNGFSQNETIDTTDSPEPETAMVWDTTIAPIDLQPGADSINSYKKSKDFAYIKYLDSLLRNSHNLKADTIHIGNAVPGKRGSGRAKQQSSPAFQSDNSTLNSPLVRLIFWILAIAFICFILYRLFLGDGFFRRNKEMRSGAEDEAEEMLTDPGSYDMLISEALKKGDFRLAIRYLYLQTLQKLTLAGFIQYSAGKTNYEYVKEMGKRNLQNEFASVTLSYEYVWYGQFNVNEQQFNRIKNEYSLFHQKI